MGHTKVSGENKSSGGKHGNMPDRRKVRSDAVEHRLADCHGGRLEQLSVGRTGQLRYDRTWEGLLTFWTIVFPM